MNKTCTRCKRERKSSRFAKGSDTCMSCAIFGTFRSTATGADKLATRCDRCHAHVKTGGNRAGILKRCIQCHTMDSTGGRPTAVSSKWT